ncbi:MAG: helix-turn-helix domain-containing protein [Selenomonadaceae bacterium]|nr:helix-turn-helix domain-containing protein [Selenomonadaceae bacterium]
MIGDILRQERERQNLTVKDIEQGTSIRALYIEAIENGEYQTLPGEVYTKGFIRNYANFLKLDADDCVRRYVSENHPEQAMAEAAREETPRKEIPRKETPVRNAPDFSQASAGYPREKGSSPKYGMMAATVVLIAVLGGGAYFLLGDDIHSTGKPPAGQVQQDKKPASGKTAEKPGSSAKENVSATNTGKGQSPQTQNTSQPASPEKKANDVQVTAKFTDRCWTKVVADGKTVYEGIAEEGKTMSWKGNEKVTITAGNAGAMELTHNGKSLGKAGAAGQVVDKVFTRDAVN